MLYGSICLFAGMDVHFLVRSDYDVLEQNGYYEVNFPENVTKKIIPTSFTDNPDFLPRSDLVIVALKTSENHILPDILPNILKEDGKVLVLQNGIGNEEDIAEFINKKAIIAGVTTTGAKRVGPGRVQAKYMGQLSMAPFVKDSDGIDYCNFLKSKLENSPDFDVFNLALEISDNHRGIRWRKLLWNIPFNLLSIVLKKPADELARNEPFQTEVREIMSEVILLAATEGVAVESRAIDDCIRITANLDNFFPSMYRDFMNEKPLEARHILDNAIQIALDNELDVPKFKGYYDQFVK